MLLCNVLLYCAAAWQWKNACCGEAGVFRRTPSMRALAHAVCLSVCSGALDDVWHDLWCHMAKFLIIVVDVDSLYCVPQRPFREARSTFLFAVRPYGLYQKGRCYRTRRTWCLCDGAKFRSKICFGGIWPACDIEGPVRAIVFSDRRALACALVRPPPTGPSFVHADISTYQPTSQPQRHPQNTDACHGLQERTQRPVPSGVPSAPSVRPCASFVRRATANA